MLKYSWFTLIGAILLIIAITSLRFYEPITTLPPSLNNAVVNKWQNMNWKGDNKHLWGIKWEKLWGMKIHASTMGYQNSEFQEIYSFKNSRITILSSPEIGLSVSGTVKLQKNNDNDVTISLKLRTEKGIQLSMIASLQPENAVINDIAVKVRLLRPQDNLSLMSSASLMSMLKGLEENTQKGAIPVSLKQTIRDSRQAFENNAPIAIYLTLKNQIEADKFPLLIANMNKDIVKTVIANDIKVSSVKRDTEKKDLATEINTWYK